MADKNIARNRKKVLTAHWGIGNSQGQQDQQDSDSS